MLTLADFDGRWMDGFVFCRKAYALLDQNHSVRGFISGTLTKKMGLSVESVKNETGERTYRVV